MEYGPLLFLILCVSLTSPVFMETSFNSIDFFSGLKKKTPTIPIGLSTRRVPGEASSRGQASRAGTWAPGIGATRPGLNSSSAMELGPGISLSASVFSSVRWG